jgi:hypothetical protein
VLVFRSLRLVLLRSLELRADELGANCETYTDVRMDTVRLRVYRTPELYHTVYCTVPWRSQETETVGSHGGELLYCSVVLGSHGSLRRAMAPYVVLGSDGSLRRSMLVFSSIQLSTGR